MPKKKKYTISSFFAGIGGFDIAFERNGFITNFLCEINPFCQSVLSQHWPNVKISNDINSVQGSDIPHSDVWCGGFPCQDISLARGASKRLGLDGTRSGLFYRYADLIANKRPEVVIIENVGGLFNSNNGRDFGMIIQTMTSLGYAVSWRLLNSRYFGVPQSRTRIYLCCWLHNPTKAINVLFDKCGVEKPRRERLDFITEASKPDEYPKVPNVSYCLAASSGRHTGTDWSRTYVVCHNGVRRMTPLEAERLQGFPDKWTELQQFVGNDEDLNTLRYTAIGNAVSVPVVEWIAKRVHSELSTSEQTEWDWQHIQDSYKDFNEGRICGNLNDIDFTDVNQTYKWQKGGIAWNGIYMDCLVPPTPSKIIKSSLLDLIEKEDVSSVYYLSPNAAEGILRRVENQGRTLFSPLRSALEKLKDKK